MTTRQMKEPRTTAPTPKALRGGVSSFNEDGSPCLAVWKALTKIKDDSDRVTSQLENRLKDRKALEKELEEMSESDDGYDEKAAEHYKVDRKISGLRAQRDQFIARYGRIIELTNENKIGTDATPKEIFSMADSKDEEEDDEEEGKTGQLKLSGAQRPGAAAEFETHAMQTPDAFGGREFGQIKPHLTTLNTTTADIKGTLASITPLRLASWIQKRFAQLKTTEDRREIFPKWPAWFHDGVMGILAECASGQRSHGDKQATVDAGAMLMALSDASKRDVEAWLHICGGKDAPLNKTILAAAKAG
jgi:hypothetical protein